MKEEIIKIIAGVAEVPEERINLKTNFRTEKYHEIRRCSF